MIRARENLIGRQFDDLLVVRQGEDYVSPNGVHLTTWVCNCKCGNKNIVKNQSYFKRANYCSCGCKSSSLMREANRKYNDYEIQEDYVIMYTKKEEAFIIDLDDFEKVRNVCWHMHKGYFCGTLNQKKVWLHRYITNCPKDMVVDHINHDTSDNRKENLRICTSAQNAKNQSTHKNNTSGITGVRWVEKQGKWHSYIRVNYKRINLGYYTYFEDAVAARKQAEDLYFGDYSCSNSLNKKGEWI